jgi:hypothetical protein
MIKSLHFPAMILSLLLAGSSLTSCGIEMYKYLNPVNSGIPMLFNTTAYISLPSEDYYFRYFIIYYRIYISDLPVSGAVDTGALAQINSNLYSDYTYFLSYTNSQSTVAPTAMENTFAGRKYFRLELENASIENVLAMYSGGNITLDFSEDPQFKPSLIMDDIRSNPGATRYQLSRNTRGNNNPYADNYYFVNSDDVNNSAHISADSSNINQDVQAGAQGGSGQYTYASMYILAYGMDDSNFSNIYSIPTFIGIFRLPNE